LSFIITLWPGKLKQQFKQFNQAQLDSLNSCLASIHPSNRLKPYRSIAKNTLFISGVMQGEVDVYGLTGNTDICLGASSIRFLPGIRTFRGRKEIGYPLGIHSQQSRGEVPYMALGIRAAHSFSFMIGVGSVI